MGKIVRWNKREGWTIGLTAYQWHIEGLHFFQRRRFPGALRSWNKTKQRKCES